MKKCLLLDRDGVINIDKGYVHKTKDIEFTGFIWNVLEEFKDFSIHIITNQSGIGRKYFTEKDFNIVTDLITEEFNERGYRIDSIQMCPHVPEDNCKCRKPGTKMLENIDREFGIDKANSILIGDKESDIECGRAFGLRERNIIKVKNELQSK